MLGLYLIVGFIYFILYKILMIDCLLLKEFVWYIDWFLMEGIFRVDCEDLGFVLFSFDMISRV